MPGLGITGRAGDNARSSHPCQTGDRVTPAVHFAIPGDLQSLTGGYAWDRRIIAGLQSLGMNVQVLPLSAGFPNPDAQALADAAARVAALPDGAVLLADGLAWGVLDDLARAHAQRLRIIAVCHHPLALESGLSSQRARALHDSEARALQAAAAVVVTSAETARTLAAQFGVAPARITVALPGTDPAPAAPCQGNPPVLLSLATLTRRKGHDVLIAALADLKDLPWTARFVGGTHFDPDWAAHLRDRVISLGLGERIAFAGSCEVPATEYGNADVFVLPSRYEGYGMVFAEALAHGLPVIAARAGAVPDVVPHDAGLLVPVDDSVALAAALRRVLTDAALRGQLREGARRAALALPRWEDSARTLAALINHLTGTTSPK